MANYFVRELGSCRVLGCLKLFSFVYLDLIRSPHCIIFYVILFLICFSNQVMSK